MSVVDSGFRLEVWLDGAFNDYHPLMYDPTESMKQQIYTVIGYYFEYEEFEDIEIVVQDTSQMEDDDDEAEPIELTLYRRWKIMTTAEELAEEVIDILDSMNIILEEDPVPQYYDENICKMMREGA